MSHVSFGGLPPGGDLPPEEVSLQRPPVLTSSVATEEDGMHPIGKHSYYEK